MTVTKCRVCATKFFTRPLLKYRNMPKSAQFLPGKKALKSDKGVNLNVYQCSGCGLVQLNNKPVFYYREVIRAASVSREMENFRMKQFRNFLNQFSLQNKKVIEIGCGRGEYLCLMKRCGADAYGLEYSTSSVKYCVKNGLKVSEGFIARGAQKIEDAPFDAFFMLNFLEHLPDPNSTLKGIWNSLRSNAVGIIEVPNFDMILRKKLFSEFTSDHLLYFTKETLNTILRMNGFDIIDCRVVWHDYIISAVVKKRIKLDISLFYKHQEKIKNQVDAYISRFKDKKVAIWGAGHQALALISLVSLADKIKYVVDSAPFKQGRYTTASHLPIVSPEELIKNPVEAVIVMAASYSDEVARIIRKKIGKDMNIAIMRDFGLEILRH